MLRGALRVQVEREQIKTSVKTREIRLVVATDAACEGLNLPLGCSPSPWWVGQASGSRQRTGAGTLEVMAIRPELADELLKLTTEERQELAGELYESLGDETIDPAWESAWSDEIARRVEEIVDGKVQLIDAADMHDQLREELRSLEK